MLLFMLGAVIEALMKCVLHSGCGTAGGGSLLRHVIVQRWQLRHVYVGMDVQGCTQPTELYCHNCRAVIIESISLNLEYACQSSLHASGMPTHTEYKVLVRMNPL